jgi:hypothetical protein
MTLMHTKDLTLTTDWDGTILTEIINLDLMLLTDLLLDFLID